MQIKRELNLLQKLYGLYNDVIDTVNGYYDILWQDVNIEKINQELLDFQNRWDGFPVVLKSLQYIGCVQLGYPKKGIYLFRDL